MDLVDLNLKPSTCIFARNRRDPYGSRGSKFSWEITLRLDFGRDPYGSRGSKCQFYHQSIVGGKVEILMDLVDLNID